MDAATAKDIVEGLHLIYYALVIIATALWVGVFSR